MSKKKHLHSIMKIEDRGKVDSVYVTCWCGHEDCFGTWFFWETNPPTAIKFAKGSGWDPKLWEATGKAVEAFLEVTNAAMQRR